MSGLIGEALRAFAAVFPAELPDKTMVATIVLVARYKHPLGVWLGAAAAFTVHVAVAVGAGRLISLLPDTAVKLVVIVLFSVGAVVLWRSADDADEALEGAEQARVSTLRAATAAFALIVLAEWGDLTQLATASLAATSDSPLGTAIGALLALWAVAALAATVGRNLVRRVPLALVHRVAAGIFAALAVLTVVDLAIA